MDEPRKQGTTPAERPTVRGRFGRAAPLVVAGLLPAFLLSGGVAQFILNHFFARAPYLWDSGLLSGITYRAGLLLPLPDITGPYAESFYQVYVSPIISVLSGLSYLVPVGRIEWFAFVEALVYLPIGIAVYVLASRVDPASRLRRLPYTMLAAFGFSFSGLVLWTVGYPHYEIATPGLICLLLAATVTGRTRLAWICLALAASVRQDGGLHAALALTPLLYLRWRGVNMPPSVRRLVVTICVAIGTSLVAISIQKLCFVPLDRLRAVYIGDPAYGHLSWSLLGDRLRLFSATCHVIYYPLFATIVLAALRRDPRYLLGWLIALPWFVFNITAYDEQKSHFTAYTVGPFLISVFWVYLYGALLTPRARRLRAGALEVVFALVCVSSTLGFYRAAPGPLHDTLREMAYAKRRDRAAVHGFVDTLHTQRAAFGRLFVDSAVAALALEWLSAGEGWQPGVIADTIVFHNRTARQELLAADFASNHIDVCTRIVGTGIVVCL